MSEEKKEVGAKRDLFESFRKEDYDQYQIIKKVLRMLFFGGGMIGGLFVGLQAVGMTPFTSREFMLKIFFPSQYLGLYSILFMHISCWLYECILERANVKGCCPMTFVEKAKTGIAMLLKYAFLVSATTTSLIGGAIMFGWTLLLISGHLWVLIGAK